MLKEVVTEAPIGVSLSPAIVLSLLDALDGPVVIAERAGRVLMANLRARQTLNAEGYPEIGELNLFSHLLHVDPKVIFTQIENGEHEVSLQIELHSGKIQSRVQWLPEPDWLVVQMDAPGQKTFERSGRTAHGGRVAAGTGNHVSEFAGGVSASAGSESAEDSFPGIGGARIEDSAGGDQRLLRSIAFWIARKASG